MLLLTILFVAWYPGSLVDRTP